MREAKFAMKTMSAREMDLVPAKNLGREKKKICLTWVSRKLNSFVKRKFCKS